MAIEKKLIHFSKLSDFETQLNAGNILGYSIIFIQDAKKIWTHGQYYDCNGGNGAFLRIGDADDEAKANFIAVANREKSADYYICASLIDNNEVNGIVSSLRKDGPSNAPVNVRYSFYGTPMGGTNQNKFLFIRTSLDVLTGVITTEYEAILDAKQDTITDLEAIREGAAKGATSVQPNDISTVATSGSYKDLQDKPVYITPFDVLSLLNLAQYPDEVGGSIQSNNTAIEEALAANKIVLVPYEISDNVFYRGYATLVGYVEDLLYFRVITEYNEIYVETTRGSAEIFSGEVTLNSWNRKQDRLFSGINIKTINGQSLLEEGDLTIEGSEGFFLPLSLFQETPTISQEDYDNLVNAINSGRVINMPLELTGDSGYFDSRVGYSYSQDAIILLLHVENLREVNEDLLLIGPDLTCLFTNSIILPKASKLSQLENDSNFISSDNLKTINGESIVGTGDIVIGGGDVIQIGDTNAILSNIEPEKVYVCRMGLQRLTIQSFSDNGSKHQEYTIVFYGASSGNITLILPEDVLWANGEIPEIENGVYYELSITRTIHGADYSAYYKAVLVPFKPV